MHIKGKSAEPGRILVLRLSSIGDILLTSAAVRLLRRRFPQARIDFVVKSQFVDLVRTNPYIDHVLPFAAEKGFGELRALKRRLKAQGYDLIVDLHNNLRTIYLRRLGAPVVRLRKYKFKRFVLVKLGIDLYGRPRPVLQRCIDLLAAWGVHDDGLGPDFFSTPKRRAASKHWCRATV